MIIGQTAVLILRTRALGYTAAVVPGTMRNADSTPTITVRKNGSTSGISATPTITNLTTGVYKVQFQFTEADWADLDSWSLAADWTMEGVSGFGQVLGQGPVEATPYHSGTVDDGSPADTNFDGAAGLSSTDDAYNGQFVVFIEGGLKGIARKVIDYTGATRTFDFTGGGFPTAPTNGDPFLVIGKSG